MWFTNDPRGMEGWVGLVCWPTADSLRPTTWSPIKPIYVLRTYTKTHRGRRQCYNIRGWVWILKARPTHDLHAGWQKIVHMHVTFDAQSQWGNVYCSNWGKGGRPQGRNRGWHRWLVTPLLRETKLYYKDWKNITSQATLQANERVLSRNNSLFCTIYTLLIMPTS